MIRLIKILFLFYCLATVSFFQPFDLVSAQAAKAISYSLLMGLLVATCLSSVSKRKSNERFRTPMVWLMILFGVACFIPTLCNFDQSVLQSFSVTLPFFSYALYFTMHRFSFNEDFIHKIIFALAICTIITHIIHLITFPVIIFGTPQDEYDLSRGGIRLVMIGFSFVVLSFFITIDKWLRTKAPKWGIFAMACYIAIFLSYTRQHILICTFLGFLMLFNHVHWYKKVIILGLGCILVMSIFPKIPAVQNMIELTQEQNERNRGNETEDIRIQAAKFYGYEQFPSLTNRLFGNGVFTFKSAWGRQMQAVTESERVYAVDVGIFGFNWSFGIFSIVCLLVVFYKAIVVRSQKYVVGRYYFIWLFVSSFASGALLYPSQIIVTVIVLYLIDTYNYKRLYLCGLKSA